MHATPRRLRDRRQAGAVFLFVAFSIVMLIGFGALVIDGANIYAYRSECQTTADAAALAAASRLPDLNAARSEAISYGAKNMATSLNGTAIDSNDVEFGRWNFDTKTFTLTNLPSQVNAVRVSARRAASNGNALPLTLGRTFGFTSTDISVTAVAAFSMQEPWDIALTQDVTGSFVEELEYAKEADQNLLDCMASQSPAETMFGIVVHTGWGKKWASLKQLATNYSSLQTSINNIKSCGQTGMPVCSGTDIAAGLEKAIEMLDASPSGPDNKQAIVLVSDGQPEPSSAGSHPSSSQTQLKNLAKAQADSAWSKGYHIFIVYFDNDGNTTAKDFVKSLIRGEGVFLSTPDPEELPDLLSSICGNLVNLRLVN